MPTSSPVAPGSRRAAVAVIAALVLIAAALAAVVGRRDHGPTYPSRWDARVVGIVRFVEHDRHLRYRHPVPVRFLTAKQYTAASAAESGTPTAADRRQAEDEVAEFRALGLMEGKVDLLGAEKKLADSGTLAFYDPSTKLVNVRGTTVTPSLRVTLAHELTHALQDQTFGLDGKTTGADQDRVMALRSILEGDAMATEDRYVDQVLTDEERTAYEKESSSSSDQAESDLSEVPDVLSTSFAAQYFVGRPFVALLQTEPGSDAVDTSMVDEALDVPPASTEQLMYPPDYVADVVPVAVPAPKWTGLKPVDRGSFGAYQLFVLLSEHIDAVEAMHAVDGWRGDAYVAGRRSTDVSVCVHARVRSSGAHVAALRTALQDWAAALPAESRAEVEAGSGSTVSFSTCDPGPDAEVGVTGRSSDAFGYPVARLQLAQSIRQGGMADVARATCMADTFVSALTLDELSADELSGDLQAKVEGLQETALATCR